MTSVADSQIKGAELFNQVAHELRQPLSNIESIAYYLGLLLPRTDLKVQEQLTRIRHLVEQSGWILSSGSRLAAPCTPAPEPLDFEELIIQEVSSGGSQSSMRLELAGNLPLIRLDPRQGRELVTTLLMLVRPLTSTTSPAVVRTSVSGEGASLELLVPPTANLLGAGSDLSIESARQIAEAHGGTLQCTADPAVGIRVHVLLPA